MSAPPYFDLFRGAVEALFNSWTALQLAVDQGMGGHNAKSMALQMVDYIAQYCCSRENVDNGEVAYLLEDIMYEQFNTICEDESPQELGNIIVRYIQLCRANNREQMLMEVANLPKCKLWLCLPQAQNILPIQPGEVVEDDDDEEGDDTEMPDEPMEEDPDPGWTVVKTRRK